MFEEDVAHHKELFSGSSLTLGRFHWMIQKANLELESRCVIKGQDNDVMSHTITEFGKEVGTDVISWWVFKKEPDIEKLLKKTNAALLHAQKLKDDALVLKEKSYPESYIHLVKELKKFTDLHEKEINGLYNYALYLHDEDVLAPCILFSYRVWGHTRRSWLTVRPSVHSTKDEQDAWAVSTEFAMGLRNEYGYTLELVYSDIWERIADSVDPEYQGQISVPEERLLLQASHEILDNFAVYFENIRESLRNIILEIEKYKSPMELLSRESFWQSFIAWTMSSNRVEDQLWDLKETLEMFHIVEKKEKTSAEVDFCENVASYANTRGGLLVLGVTDKHPRKVVGVKDLENRMKFAMLILARYVDHKINFVHFQPVIMKDENGTDQNCLVIAVAQTKDVIPVKNDEGRFSYPVRLATGLDRSTYDEIKEHKQGVLRDNYEFLLTIDSLLNAR